MEPIGSVSSLRDTQIAPMYGITWRKETLLFIYDIF